MVIILQYVLLGIVLYIFIIPIIEELATLAVQWLEILKAKMLITISELKAQVKKDKEEESDTSSEKSTNVIGFTLPQREEDYEEEYEEDE